MSRPISELPQFLSDLTVGIVEVLQQTAGNIKTRMSESGSPSTSPVQWDNDRQRRYVMWKLGGEPYQRTGEYERSWTVQNESFGAVLSAPSPAAAIGGFPAGWQSRIHRGRWNNLTRVLFDELGKIPDKLSNLFEVLSR